MRFGSTRNVDCFRKRCGLQVTSGCTPQTTLSAFASSSRCNHLVFPCGGLIDLRTDKVDACEAVEELLKDKLADTRRKMRQLEELESELVADLRKCSPELHHRQRPAACGCPVLEEANQ
jgi:hypothetical protein